MVKSIDATVAIIGAGPSGLLLSQLLHQSGISSVIVERTSKKRVLERIRAGILERGTVEGMEEAGCAERLHAECIPHDGVILSFDGEQFEIPVKAITGHQVIVYGQTEITKDLIDACEARGQRIYWDCADAELAGLDSNVPQVGFTTPTVKQSVSARTSSLAATASMASADSPFPQPVCASSSARTPLAGWAFWLINHLSRTT